MNNLQKPTKTHAKEQTETFFVFYIDTPYYTHIIRCALKPHRGGGVESMETESMSKSKNVRKMNPETAVADHKMMRGVDPEAYAASIHANAIKATERRLPSSTATSTTWCRHPPLSDLA